MKIVFLTYYNPYHAVEYMTKQLTEALIRKGFDVQIISYEEKATLIKYFEGEEPFLFCSFSGIHADSLKQLVHFRNQHRWLYLRLDPIDANNNTLIDVPELYIGHVDKYECNYLKKRFPKTHVKFFPHAVDPYLNFNEDENRPYDLVFCASSYDHETVLKKIQTLNPRDQKFVFNCIARYQRDPEVTVNELIANEPPEHLNRLRYLIDAYVRAKDRFDLINSITDVQIHLVGGTGFDSEQFPVRGWSEIFWDKSNVTVYPAMDFEETFKMMRRSKIVLNTMPFFKNGTHERVFNSLALGALPLTMKNKWFEENFVDGEELVFYEKDRINEQIAEILKDESKRREIVRRGREKVMRDHTWDNRADQIIEWLKLNPTPLSAI